MDKFRIPLPGKVEKVHRSDKDYDRKRDKDVTVEWEVDCTKCGIFTQVQKTEPTICPRCHCPDIDTSPL